MAIKLSRINTGAPNWGGVANNNWGVIEQAINTSEETLNKYAQTMANLKVGTQFGGYIKYMKSQTTENEGYFAVSNSYLTSNDDWNSVAASNSITMAINANGTTTAGINTFYILVGEVNSVKGAAKDSFFAQSWEDNTAVLYATDADGKSTFSAIYLNSYVYKPSEKTNEDLQIVFEKKITSTAPDTISCSFPSGAVACNCKYYQLAKSHTIDLDAQSFYTQDGMLTWSIYVKFATITWNGEEVNTYAPFEVDYSIKAVRDSAGEITKYQLIVDSTSSFTTNDYAIAYILNSTLVPHVNAITAITVTSADNN